MNIKGVFQIWMKDGSYHEIDLKECHQWTREGCKHCPDFAAEHADISTGGIGEDNDWTLTIVRTELGEEVIDRMIADGTIIARPAQEDEKAMKLLRTLSIVEPPALALDRRPGAGDRRAASEEEGRRAGSGRHRRPRADRHGQRHPRPRPPRRRLRRPISRPRPPRGTAGTGSAGLKRRQVALGRQRREGAVEATRRGELRLHPAGVAASTASCRSAIASFHCPPRAAIPWASNDSPYSGAAPVRRTRRSGRHPRTPRGAPRGCRRRPAPSAEAAVAHGAGELLEHLGREAGVDAHQVERRVAHDRRRARPDRARSSTPAGVHRRCRQRLRAAPGRGRGGRASASVWRCRRPCCHARSVAVVGENSSWWSAATKRRSSWRRQPASAPSRACTRSPQVRSRRLSARLKSDSV